MCSTFECTKYKAYRPVGKRILINKKPFTHRTLALAKVVTGVYLLPPMDSEDTYDRMYALVSAYQIR